MYTHWRCVRLLLLLIGSASRRNSARYLRSRFAIRRGCFFELAKQASEFLALAFLYLLPSLLLRLLFPPASLLLHLFISVRYLLACFFITSRFSTSLHFTSLTLRQNLIGPFLQVMSSNFCIAFHSTHFSVNLNQSFFKKCVWIITIRNNYPMPLFSYNKIICYNFQFLSTKLFWVFTEISWSYLEFSYNSAGIECNSLRAVERLVTSLCYDGKWIFSNKSANLPNKNTVPNKVTEGISRDIFV